MNEEIQNWNGSKRWDEEYFRKLVNQLRDRVEWSEQTLADILSYVHAVVNESELSAIHSIQSRDKALEELADLKRQNKSDVRNHPDFLKMQDQLGKSQKALYRRSALCDISEARIALCEREIDLYREE